MSKCRTNCLYIQSLKTCVTPILLITLTYWLCVITRSRINMHLRVFFKRFKKQLDKLQIWIIVNRSETQSFISLIFAYFAIFLICSGYFFILRFSIACRWFLNDMLYSGYVLVYLSTQLQLYQVSGEFTVGEFIAGEFIAGTIGRKLKIIL